MALFDFFTGKEEKKGNGYVGYSKSVNAKNAESNGKFPASIIAKKTKTSAKWVAKKFAASEWHHTSKEYNKTNYYDLEEVKDFIAENPNSYKEWAEEQKTLKPITRKAKEVEWIEWQGTKARPKAIKRTAQNINVTYNGKDTYTFKVGSETITKRKNTNGFYVTWQPTKEEAAKQKAEAKKYATEQKAFIKELVDSFNRGVANGDFFEVKSALLPKSGAFKKIGRAWAAIKNNKVVDIILMREAGKLDFESFREQSKAKLAKKGKVVSGEVKSSFGGKYSFK